MIAKSIWDLFKKLGQEELELKARRTCRGSLEDHLSNYVVERRVPQAKTAEHVGISHKSGIQYEVK